MKFGFDLGEDFAVFLGLFAGEFAVLAAYGEVVLVFGLGGLQIGLYARDGGVKVLLGEFAFPDGDDGPGEGVEALGVVPSIIWKSYRRSGRCSTRHQRPMPDSLEATGQPQGWT